MKRKRKGKGKGTKRNKIQQNEKRSKEKIEWVEINNKLVHFRYIYQFQMGFVFNFTQ